MREDLYRDGSPASIRVALDLTATQRDRLTGWERFALQLRAALCENARDRLEITDLRRRFHVSGRTSALMSQLTWRMGGMRRAVRRTMPDVVHAPAFPPPELPVPVVWTVHDDLILGGHPKFARRGALIWTPLARSAVRRVQMVVTDTEAVAGELGEQGVPEERLRVIRPGVPELPKDDVKPRRLRYLSDGDEAGFPSTFLLTVGTLEPRKLPGTAVLAARRLGLPLVLVGLIDPLLGELPHHAGLLHASGLSDRELAWLYRHAAALIAPSAYEGFDFPVVEALAEGLPVAASDIPVHREVGGPHVQYFPVGDVEVAAHATAKAMSRPRQPVHVTRWQDTAEAYAALYREVVSK